MHELSYAQAVAICTSRLGVGVNITAMGGAIWQLWESFDDEGSPPRILEEGRWLDVGWVAFWHHALLGVDDDPVSPVRLRLRPDSGAILFDGWEELPGVAQVKAWATADLGVLRELVKLQTTLDGGETTNRPRLVTELFARAAPHRSAEAFIACARAETDEQSFPAPEPPVRPPEPTIRFAEVLERAVSAEPELYGWLVSRVDGIPAHAQLVGPRHRKHGSPAPGSVWWRLEQAPDECVFACHRDVYSRELAAGRRADFERITRNDAAGNHIGGSTRFLGVMDMDTRRASPWDTQVSQVAIASDASVLLRAM